MVALVARRLTRCASSPASPRARSSAQAQSTTPRHRRTRCFCGSAVSRRRRAVAGRACRRSVGATPAPPRRRSFAATVRPLPRAPPAGCVRCRRCCGSPTSSERAKTRAAIHRRPGATPPPRAEAAEAPAVERGGGQLARAGTDTLRCWQVAPRVRLKLHRREDARRPRGARARRAPFGSAGCLFAACFTASRRPPMPATPTSSRRSARSHRRYEAPSTASLLRRRGGLVASRKRQRPAEPPGASACGKRCSGTRLDRLPWSTSSAGSEACASCDRAESIRYLFECSRRRRRSHPCTPDLANVASISAAAADADAAAGVPTRHRALSDPCIASHNHLRRGADSQALFNIGAAR